MLLPEKLRLAEDVRDEMVTFLEGEDITGLGERMIAWRDRLSSAVGSSEHERGRRDALKELASAMRKMLKPKSLHGLIAALGGKP